MPLEWSYIARPPRVAANKHPLVSHALTVPCRYITVDPIHACRHIRTLYIIHSLLCSLIFYLSHFLYLSTISNNNGHLSVVYLVCLLLLCETIIIAIMIITILISNANLLLSAEHLLVLD